MLKFVNGCITNVEKLQNYCRLNYVNFYSLRVMLHSLAAVERQNKNLLKNLMNNLKQHCTYGTPRISNYEYGQLQIIIIIIKKKF